MGITEDYLQVCFVSMHAIVLVGIKSATVVLVIDKGVVTVTFHWSRDWGFRQ